MNKDQLFLSTCADIENKIKTENAYEILLVAGLLRKLLLDGNSLVDQVNRSRKLKIKYHINDRPLDEITKTSSFWSIQDGFDPDTSHHSVTKEVNERDLLKANVLKVAEEYYSVLELIKYLNNVVGSVHVGDAEDRKDIVLQKITQNLQIGGLNPVIRSLKSIARVVLKGLDPLIQEVASNV